MSLHLPFVHNYYQLLLPHFIRSFSAPLPTGTEGARCVAEILANLDSDQLLAPACRSVNVHIRAYVIMR